MIRRWSPDGLAPPIGKYSHLAQVPTGHELVVISGRALAGPDAESQTSAALANIEKLLDSIGAGPQHLVKLFAMLSSTEHLAGYRTALQERLATWYPSGDRPAHSLIVVAALAAPELTVEIEAMVAVGVG
jgi:enamine deaminase RidA (YjgF/YER057c/UK114 family)